MRRDTILKSFQATGVWPMDAEFILKRFNNHASEQDKAVRPGQQGDGDSWTQLRKSFDAAVADKAKVEAKRLSQSIHSLQVNNALLHDQNESLKQQLNAKSKPPIKRTALNTQDGEEWHGGAVWWSPRRLRRHRERKAAEQDEAEQQQLQKARDRELREASKLYQKQQQEAAKVARQEAAEERAKAKKARAEELAAARALKKQQREAATSQKSYDTSNTAKRKGSHKVAKNPAKRRRVVAAASRVDAGPPAASPPPKISARGRQIKTPAKFK